MPTASICDFTVLPGLLSFRGAGRLRTSLVSTLMTLFIALGATGLGGDARAQIENATIQILPDSAPSVSDVVVARVSYYLPQCFDATPAVRALPGGTFEIYYSVVSVFVPFPCSRTFDVTLGTLPIGTYVVNLRPLQTVILATTTFQVRAAPAAIPTLSWTLLMATALLVAICTPLVRRSGSARPPLSPPGGAG